MKSMAHLRTIEASKARLQFSDLANRVAYQGDRIVITRHGKAIACLVPVEDVEFLERREDEIDVADARAALKEGGRPIPWDELRVQLGLAPEKRTPRSVRASRIRASRRAGR